MAKEPLPRQFIAFLFCSIILPLLFLVYPMTWLLKVFFIFICAICFVFIVERSEWTLNKKRWQKNCLSLLIISALVATNYSHIRKQYLEVHSPVIPYEMITEWAGKGGLLFMTIDSKYLSAYKNEYNLLLIGEVPLMGVDKMTNKSIKKSVAYTITDSQMTLAVNIIGISVLINDYATGGMRINTILVLIPKDVSPEEIVTLSDVERMGGKIIGQRGATVFPNHQEPKS